MKKNRILLFAGTTEGRKLAEYLAERSVRIHVCVATEYGEGLLPKGNNITVSHERMDAEEIENVIDTFAPDFVIDATHPYAGEVTENIRKACERAHMEYLRVVREENKTSADCIFVESVSEAVDYLRETEGRILAATGSKELSAFTELEDYQTRVYARVLSISSVVEKCEALGFSGRNLICMQGPFSVEMNVAMMRQYGISYLVTKESGKAGGFPEKCQAAACAGVTLVVIGRPWKETGYSLEEMYALLDRRLEESDRNKVKRNIVLVGIGPGSESDMTLRTRRICERAQLIIGAKRMTEASAGPGQAVFVSYDPEEIVSYIREHTEYVRIAVVFSGDIGFYSGAKKLYGALRKERENGIPMEIALAPGISSVIYFCAKRGISWEDAKLLSLHGKQENLIAAVRDNKKVLALTGNERSVRAIGRTLSQYGYGNLQVSLGEELSYPSERITEQRAKDLSEYEGSGLAVLYVENPDGGNRQVSGGISDRAFLRGEIPMTKEEVRCVSLAKLRLQKDSVVYDIGAGTGSVSVEAALFAEKGKVYAVERKAEAARLIEKNKKKFGAENLSVIDGDAPEALIGLPEPDRVFIGGSGGHLKEIICTVVKKRKEQRCGKQRDLRFVINAISLETVAESMMILKELRHLEQIAVKEEEIVQLTVAKANPIGNHHMMTGQNPIYVISFSIVAQ